MRATGELNAKRQARQAQVLASPPADEEPASNSLRKLMVSKYCTSEEGERR
jgi:hypothetical protein